MICEYFAGAVDAVQRVEREPYCISTNRLEVSKLCSSTLSSHSQLLYVNRVVFLNQSIVK